MNNFSRLQSCGDLSNALVKMTSLYNIISMVHTMDSSGVSRDFQFDLEVVLTLSLLVGNSAEERNVASVMLDILACTKNKTAAEASAEIVTEAPQSSGQHCEASQSDCA